MLTTLVEVVLNGKAELTVVDVGALLKFNPSVENCHWMLPTYPVILNVPPPNEQIVPPPEIVPGTEIAFTVMVLTALIAVEQVPLVTVCRT